MSKKIDVIPGVFPPSEIMQALKDDLETLKLFPAGNLGTGNVKSLLGLFPGVKLGSVGGVYLENSESFLKSGCIGLGIGSELVPHGSTTAHMEQVHMNAVSFQKLVGNAAKK